jgi:hypothetical protein
MIPLEDQLAALSAMSSAELREEWQRVIGTPAPAIPITLIERAIAYELQAKRHGGLRPALRRTIERMAKEMEKRGSVRSFEPSLLPGTRLSRDWHGRTYHVLVLEDGFQFQDRHYRSLTQIAGAITGTAWSGPRFFGLSRPAKAAEAVGG